MNDTVRTWLTRKPIVMLINVLLGVVIVCPYTAISSEFSLNSIILIILMGAPWGMLTTYNIWVQLPNFPVSRLILVIAIPIFFFASALMSGNVWHYFRLISPLLILGIIGHRGVLERMIAGFIFTMMTLGPMFGTFSALTNSFNPFHPSWYLVAIAVGGIIGFAHWLIYHRSRLDDHDSQRQISLKNNLTSIITPNTPDEKLFYDDDDEAMSQRQAR